jgi:hypothetical protein
LIGVAITPLTALTASTGWMMGAFLLLGNEVARATPAATTTAVTSPKRAVENTMRREGLYCNQLPAAVPEERLPLILIGRSFVTTRNSLPSLSFS